MSSHFDQFVAKTSFAELGGGTIASEKRIVELLLRLRPILLRLDMHELQRFWFIDNLTPEVLKVQGTWTTATSVGALTSSLGQHAVVARGPNNTFQYCNLDPSAAAPQLPADTLCFCHDNGNSRLVLGDTEAPLTSLFDELPQPLFPMCFRNLRDALEYYRSNVAKDCICPTLQEAFAGEDRRYLKSKPEATMQQSLWYFLRCRLGGDAEVRREQTTSPAGSHPIDIRVTWHTLYRVALVEIKWVGQSVDEHGNLKTGYSDPRANEGASQLADYVDREKASAPGMIIRGVLVVFDARRKGIQVLPAAPTDPELLHYELVELVFTPMPQQKWPHMEEPIRLYIRPVLKPHARRDRGD